jgi:ArsR family transcriptional regulator
LQILALLRDGERCVCDLVEAMEVGQSLLSFHLKTLKDAGLVTDRREGRWVHYRLVPGALAGLEETLRSLREAAEMAGGAVRMCR